MRTQGAYYADTPHGGGFFFYGPDSMLADANGSVTRTSGPPITYQLHVPSTDASNIYIGLKDLKRLLEYPSNYPKVQLPHAELFGTNVPLGSGVNVNQAGWVEGAPGFPPYTGATQLTPPTADPPKGLEIVNITLFYSVNTVDASAGTIALYRNTFANNVAVSQATLLAATNITLTQRANPYVITTAVTTPVFETTDLTDVFAELAVTAGSGGTIDVYGVGFHVLFNYN